MTERKRIPLDFIRKDGVFEGMPIILPIDKETGREIDGVRRCEVVSELQNGSAVAVTVMRIEVILFDPTEKPKT